MYRVWSCPSGISLVLLPKTNVTDVCALKFVAMPLGHGYTIEEQITGEAKQGGIQVDVYPLISTSVEFKDENDKLRDINMSPKELGIVKGKRISMILK